MDALIEKDQHKRFSGSGAAHQKGVSKRGIQKIIQMSRNMLIHYVMRSPQVTITAEMWLIEIVHLVWMYNRMPHKDSGMSIFEHWS